MLSENGGQGGSALVLALVGDLSLFLGTPLVTSLVALGFAAANEGFGRALLVAGATLGGHYGGIVLGAAAGWFVAELIGLTGIVGPANSGNELTLAGIGVFGGGMLGGVVGSGVGAGLSAGALLEE